MLNSELRRRAGLFRVGEDTARPGVGRRRGSTLLKPEEELCWDENLGFTVRGQEEHPAGRATPLLFNSDTQAIGEKDSVTSALQWLQYDRARDHPGARAVSGP